MWHTALVSCRASLLLLWIEHRIARLRRLIDRPPASQALRQLPPPLELFDRRDLRAKW